MSVSIKVESHRQFVDQLRSTYCEELRLVELGQEKLKEGMMVELQRVTDNSTTEGLVWCGWLAQMQLVDEHWVRFRIGPDSQEHRAILLVPVKFVQLGLISRVRYRHHYGHWPEDLLITAKSFPINPFSMINHNSTIPSKDLNRQTHNSFDGASC
ncbi:hypothetical protein CVT26_003003 [Gymnopilus dilepis]|uniref:Uncharacterized protein n=1 Tax=Gymnopilus dilepis TaxID=231916 RepID=A0A409WT49_9AGAR|nr:hypothetical protein CVT26_003003 [Gymnopilus dilepis]